MKNVHDILFEPLVTEKTTSQTALYNKYAFRVAPAANKIEIKRAVEQLYRVKVTKVNTMINPGKSRAMNPRHPGSTTPWKKAVVTLRAGDSIELV